MKYDLHKKYNLRKVLNACGKMTYLSASPVLPEVIEAVAEALRHNFELDPLQAAAGRIIAEATGAEGGCITACCASGITLGVAACMTGFDIGKVRQLPDAAGMPDRILIQKGHCVDYGQPITQAIRLAGAQAVEVGTVNRCTPEEIRHALAQGNVAAMVAVESHHTVQYGYVELSELIRLAHEAGVPVIVDGAAQDLRCRELIAGGVDLLVMSAHKYLCSTTAGIVAGRKELVEAVYLQNRGIGRGMKAGKEAMVGAMAALEYRMRMDVSAWQAEQDRKVGLIQELLAGVPGLSLEVEPDPNGNPFSRARLMPDPEATGHTAASLAAALAEGDPTVVARAHHASEGYICLDAVDLADGDIRAVCRKVCRILKGRK